MQFQIPTQLFHEKPRYSDERGPVRYLDGRGLARPFEMPRSQMAVAALFVAAAAVIGVYLLVTVLGGVSAANARAQASVEDNLAREVSYDLPVLTQLAVLEDDAIRQTLTDAGYTLYDMSSSEESSGLDLVKLPSDVTLAEAGVMYAKGVSSLSAGEAALLLNGSWTLDVDRSDGLSLRVRYADFSSGSLEAAVQAAIAAEGFDPATTPQDGSGVDEMGNTYQSGTVDVGGTTYTWRVSAIALSDIYDISGLPETSVYVGIRLTA